jgi:hypothetical protein
MDERQRLWAGLYIVTLVVVSTTLISLFSESQSGQSIIILFAMTLTFALSTVLLVIRKQPESPSEKWFTTDNPFIAILVSLLVNVIWSLLYRFFFV